MKHSFIRKFLSVMLSCSVMVLNPVNGSSEEYAASEALDIYRHKVELLNGKYGTDFHIAEFDMTETELNDMLTEYLNMTDEEFEQHFLDMKESSERFLKEQSETHVMYSESSKITLDDLLRSGYEISVCRDCVEVEDITV